VFYFQSFLTDFTLYPLLTTSYTARAAFTSQSLFFPLSSSQTTSVHVPPHPAGFFTNTLFLVTFASGFSLPLDIPRATSTHPGVRRWFVFFLFLPPQLRLAAPPCASALAMWKGFPVTRVFFNLDGPRNMCFHNCPNGVLTCCYL